MSNFNFNDQVVNNGKTHFGGIHNGDNYNVKDISGVTGELIIGKNNTITNTTIASNFHNCAIGFQGELSNLASDLKQAGHDDDSKYIESVNQTVNDMEEILNSAAEDTNVEEVMRKKGFISRINEFFEEIIDTGSDLYNKIAKLRNGAKKIQQLLEYGKELATLLPFLPQTLGI